MSKEQIVKDIIYHTRFWNVPDWYQFRNVFISDYYELRFSKNRSDFNEWKIKKIIEFNKLNNN